MKKALPMFAQIVMLPITPENSAQAYNRLCALDALDKMHNPQGGNFVLRPMSKRRERLLRMYWAFRKKEAQK